jgi:uncharacterized protein YyaL (SSP411 family)
MPSPKHTNRLADETSPYLLQHAHNPVDWYPWGEEALARAHELDRPIFLSVGYAACHWCHVMERESFEDEQTAADLNEHFVSIKVDREERPDIDSVYMGAVQAMTGQGGWPMSVFMTSEGKPFYGGTYFPDEPRHGMPSFRQLLARITQVWTEQREDVEASATKVAEAIEAQQRAPQQLLDEATAEPLRPLDERMRSIVATLRESFDPVHGGWGHAPKFPQAMTVELLLREHLRSGDTDAQVMAAKALDEMARGGIYDHLGGGFARYSTDAAWLVPHFEKMLYDNALLARTYAHAAKVLRDDHYAYVARETLDFVAHELRVPRDGAFAASLDADTQGVEGLTYIWRASEVRELLGPTADLFAAAYDVTEQGNWEGGTILRRVRSDTDLAAEFERPRDAVVELLAEARVTLLRARDERPQPARDDKVLTSWNGLMIAAFADVGKLLEETDFVTIATQAADFVLARLRRPDGRLLRSWKDDRALHDGTLEDYSHLADGLLALYEATFEERFFVAARELADTVLEHFGAADGGFYDTADDAESLITRPRTLQDNAVPSGAAMATLVLLRLAALTGEGRYRSAAERALAPMTDLATRYPTGFAQWLAASLLSETPIAEVAIVGDPAADETRALLAVAREGHQPARVVASSATPGASAVPLLAGRAQIEGAATAYVCRDFACQRPTTDPDELRRQLERAATA